MTTSVVGEKKMVDGFLKISFPRHQNTKTQKSTKTSFTVVYFLVIFGVLEISWQIYYLIHSSTIF